MEIKRLDLENSVKVGPIPEKVNKQCFPFTDRSTVLKVWKIPATVPDHWSPMKDFFVFFAIDFV